MKIVVSKLPPVPNVPGDFFSVVVHGKNDIKMPVEKIDRPHGFPITEALAVSVIYSNGLGIPVVNN